MDSEVGWFRMDVLPSGGIFRELQAVHDTGYFSGQASLEEDWQQVSFNLNFDLKYKIQIQTHT